RDARPGVKFMDADLIGVPYRITVGMRGLKEGVVEIKERASGAVEKVKIGEAVDYCLSKLENTGNDY
ncbi:MAG TPA: His/Gly/Thr/Pro-type tRNA ligase C-terminal domain-containing protein, partial [Deltaproteobacteria bacterium]|nr:His/Gly/Thr/Pro-type tRNA ligase C-terminal domain-containing protein [Deltaproteobacteria bacterium]